MQTKRRIPCSERKPGLSSAFPLLNCIRVKLIYASSPWSVIRFSPSAAEVARASHFSFSGWPACPFTQMNFTSVSYTHLAVRPAGKLDGHPIMQGLFYSFKLWYSYIQRPRRPDMPRSEEPSGSSPSPIQRAFPALIQARQECISYGI